MIVTEANFEQPKIQYIGKGRERKYLLLEDYTFEWSEKGNTYRRTVFSDAASCAIDGNHDDCDVTDLASVPGLGGVSSAIGITPYGASDGGAVIHDDTYYRMLESGVFVPGSFQIKMSPLGVDGAFAASYWADCTEKMPRLRADLIYRRMCLAGGMLRVDVETEFLALRVGGFSKQHGWKKGFVWYFS